MDPRESGGILLNMMQRARTTGQYLFTEALNPNNTFDPTKNTERMSEVIPEFAPEKRREMSEKEIRKARELAAENYLNSSRKGEEVIQRSITDLDNTPIMDGVVAQRKKDLFEITTNLSKAILREVLPNITNIKIPPRRKDEKVYQSKGSGDVALLKGIETHAAIEKILHHRQKLLSRFQDSKIDGKDDEEGEEEKRVKAKSGERKQDIGQKLLNREYDTAPLYSTLRGALRMATSSYDTAIMNALHTTNKTILAACYSNRCLANLYLRNYKKCMADAFVAIDYYWVEVENHILPHLPESIRERFLVSISTFREQEKVIKEGTEEEKGEEEGKHSAKEKKGGDHDNQGQQSHRHHYHHHHRHHELAHQLQIYSKKIYKVARRGAEACMHIGDM
mmetsp:Transcript_24581/g.39449  ORF Transcript_24581/g.39449 Transcript_24581/m.39449 type:complete len:393 (+) Transcript_24581:49-1227(+)